MKMKNNKAPGADAIPSELFKHGGDALYRAIHALIGRIWQQEKLPADWTKRLICPVYKKGNKLDYWNYQPITLLSTTYKVFSTILLRRLKTFTERDLEEHQSGFREGRSTLDQIFTLRITIEKFFEFNEDLHICLLTLSKL